MLHILPTKTQNRYILGIQAGDAWQLETKQHTTTHTCHKAGISKHKHPRILS